MTERTNNLTEAEGSSKTIIFFDIDNTLINGFSIMLFAEYLRRRSILREQVYSQMAQDMELPKQTEEEYTYFAEVIVSHFYTGLKGLKAEEVETEGRRFLSEYQTNLKPFARELVGIMKEQGEMIAVSGAPRETFQPLAIELGIKLHLLEGEVIDGIYTGQVRVNMALGTEKRKAVQEINSAGFSPQTSYAFGDHLDHDSPILDVVSNPFFILDENDPGREPKTRAALAKGYLPVTQNNIIEEVKKRVTEIEQKSRF